MFFHPFDSMHKEGKNMYEAFRTGIPVIYSYNFTQEKTDVQYLKHGGEL